MLIKVCKLFYLETSKIYQSFYDIKNFFLARPPYFIDYDRSYARCLHFTC